jgi:CopG family nickel-responsive transcriptional regulator
VSGCSSPLSSEAADHADDDAVKVGELSYVYDHHDQALNARRTATAHDHHNLVIATLHTQLDHDRCLEVSVLRGAVTELCDLAEHTIAERGVRYGHLHLIADDAGRAPWSEHASPSSDRHNTDNRQ